MLQSLPICLTGEEEVVYGDSGYLGADKRPEALKKNKTGKAVHYKLNRRPSVSKNRSVRSKAQIKRREHEKSSVRAKVEHVFAVLKQQLRFRKTRYRGLRKQIAKLNMMFASADILTDILGAPMWAEGVSFYLDGIIRCCP